MSPRDTPCPPPPTLTFLSERWNILQHQTDLLELLADDVLPTAAWSAAKLFSFCRTGRWLYLGGHQVVAGCERASGHGAERWYRGCSASQSSGACLCWAQDRINAPSQWSLGHWTRSHGHGRWWFCWEVTFQCCIVAQRGWWCCKLVTWCTRRCCDAYIEDLKGLMAHAVSSCLLLISVSRSMVLKNYVYEIHDELNGVAANDDWQWIGATSYVHQLRSRSLVAQPKPCRLLVDWTRRVHPPTQPSHRTAEGHRIFGVAHCIVILIYFQWLKISFFVVVVLMLNRFWASCRAGEMVSWFHP